LSRLLLAVLLYVFLTADAPIILLVDETLERRQGRRIRWRGWVRSTAHRVAYRLGIRWLCLAVLVPVPWSKRPWALPFLAVPAPTAKTSQKLHRHPLRVIRVVCRDEAGQLLFRRPMWLAVCGERRAELTAEQACQGYRQRFDQEQRHRFGRQRLLIDAFQTPETEREENGLLLVGLAYARLFAARGLAGYLPRPWEPAQPARPATVARPTTVQRDFARILSQIGTPARAAKRCGNGPGRAKGTSPGRRRRFGVVRKRPKVA
jgi:hypothetical protein